MSVTLKLWSGANHLKEVFYGKCIRRHFIQVYLLSGIFPQIIRYLICIMNAHDIFFGNIISYISNIDCVNLYVWEVFWVCVAPIKWNTSQMIINIMYYQKSKITKSGIIKRKPAVFMKTNWCKVGKMANGIFFFWKKNLELLKVTYNKWKYCLVAYPSAGN